MARTVHQGGGTFHLTFLSVRLVLVTALLSACVIPVRPEFEEPEINTAPYLVSSTPPELSTVTSVVPGQGPPLTVVLGDANVGDRLHLRWLFDYPPYEQGKTKVGPEPILAESVDGTPERASTTLQPSCLRHGLDPNIRVHKVLLLVADRPYAVSDNLEELASKDGHLLKVGWLLDLQCRGSEAP